MEATEETEAMEESWVNGAYGGNGGVIGERRNHRIMEES
jgi:hypothetical protein